jgi:hypothetical protein
MLFLDGHFSHITLEVVDLARANNITIICIPPHSSHALQPLDVGVFGVAKTTWKKILEENNLALDKSIIDKKQFVKLLVKLFERSFTK